MSVDLVGEALGDVDRVLAGHRIGDEQDLVRRRGRGDRLHLVHQRLIDMQPAGRVEHQHVIALQLRGVERAAGDLDRLLAGDDRQGRDLRLAAEHGELLLRGRAGDVERGHQDLLAVLLGEALGELGGGRGLARALQADHHDDRGRRDLDLQLDLLGAEHLDERVVDDLDDLLARRDRAQHLLADRLLGRLVDELADHGQARRRPRAGRSGPRASPRARRLRSARRGRAAGRRRRSDDRSGSRTFHSPHPLDDRRAKRKTPAGETSPASVRHRRFDTHPSSGCRAHRKKGHERQASTLRGGLNALPSLDAPGNDAALHQDARARQRLRDPRRPRERRWRWMQRVRARSPTDAPGSAATR